MTKNYRVQWMTYEQYDRYMSGAIFYNFQTEYVEAETPEQAKAIVKMTHDDCYQVNDCIITKEQEEAEAAAKAAAFAAEQQKREDAKARKIARDLANGITPEKRKALTNQKRHESAVRGLRAKIAELEAEIAEHERKAAWWAEEAARL